MYTVVQVGNQQIKVSEGDKIEVGRIIGKDGDNIKLDKVLMVVKDNDVRIGQPYLKDVSVEAKLVKQSLGDKTIAFKYRRRKSSASKVGHRQKLTALHIIKISA